MIIIFYYKILLNIYMISFLFLFSIIFCSNSILFNVGEYSVLASDFYQEVPRNDWVELDSLKKTKAVNSFLERELSYYDALSYGLDDFPKIKSKLSIRYNQLLINNTYEQLVAFPLIDSLSLSLTSKHIKEEVLAYHLLVGYNGCKLPGSFSRSQEEAFSYTDSLKAALQNSIDLSDSSSIVSSFTSFASDFSEDPSVKDNAGLIGWISWGRVMSSFQKEAFNIPFYSISDPVLTVYGYHLILIIDKRPSQYAYYNPLLLDDLSKKICLQSLSFEDLRSASTFFDSSLVSSSRLLFNNPVIEKMYSIIKEKEKEGSRGNKGSYLSWFNEKAFKDVCFVYDNKAFGLGWFLYHLEQTPSTRIKTIKTTADIKSLFRSFLLQDRVISLGKEAGVIDSPFFVGEFLNHKKNILKNEYLSYLYTSLPDIDSSFVQKKYSSGVFKEDYLAPRRVVYTEIKVSTETEINKIYNEFLNIDSFDDISKKYGGQTKNPVSFTTNNPVISNAFLLSEGEVSQPLLGRDSLYSLIRVEKILEEAPFELSRVYQQIERKITKERQDSIQQNLLYALKNKYDVFDINLP